MFAFIPLVVHTIAYGNKTKPGKLVRLERDLSRAKLKGHYRPARAAQHPCEKPEKVKNCHVVYFLVCKVTIVVRNPANLGWHAAFYGCEC